MSELNRPHIDRPAEWGTMDPLEYKGFVIDKYMNITKDGKPIFTSRCMQCWSLQEAKNLIDASEKARALPSLSNYSPMVLLDHDEYQERDRQDMEDKLNNYYEMQNDNV